MRYLPLAPVFLLLVCCGPETDDEHEQVVQKQEPVVQAPPEDPQQSEVSPPTLPGGGLDPRHLLEGRSAQAMAQAEKSLAEKLKRGEIEGVDRMVPFEEISSWPYQDRLLDMPKRLHKLNGKQVVMVGFMLPLDEIENIREFLLVQSLATCCFGEPPDINGVVVVVMKGKKRVDYGFEPVKIVGRFKIKPVLEDGFCVSIYELSADSVEVIK